MVECYTDPIYKKQFENCIEDSDFSRILKKLDTFENQIEQIANKMGKFYNLVDPTDLTARQRRDFNYGFNETYTSVRQIQFYTFSLRANMFSIFKEVESIATEIRTKMRDWSLIIQIPEAHVKRVIQKIAKCHRQTQDLVPKSELYLKDLPTIIVKWEKYANDQHLRYTVPLIARKKRETIVKQQDGAFGSEKWNEKDIISY